MHVPRASCEAIPDPFATGMDKAMAEETIRFYELNIGHDVADERQQTVKRIAELASDIERGLDHKRDILTEMACRFRPHSSVVRALIDNRFPELIPGLAEEMFRLIAEPARRVNQSNEQLRSAVDKRVIEREEGRRKERLYALATLWLAPPVLDADIVAQALQDLGVLDQVTPIHAELRDAQGGSS